MEVATNSAPCQFLTANDIVSSSRLNDLVERVKIDMFACNAHVEVDVDPETEELGSTAEDKVEREGSVSIHTLVPQRNLPATWRICPVLPDSRPPPATHRPSFEAPLM